MPLPSVVEEKPNDTSGKSTVPLESRNLTQKLLLQNGASMYGVQLGRKLVPLVSIPYLALKLGPTGWGQVAFLTAMADLVVVLIEFGFTISATRSISDKRFDKVALGQIVSGVLGAQSLLCFSGIAIVSIFGHFSPYLRNHPGLVVSACMYAIAQGMLPTWYFQGMERIWLAAILELSGKLAALASLFLFVRSPADIWKVLLIQAVSPGLSAIIGIYLAVRGTAFCWPRIPYIRSALRDGWQMFLFRSGESLYGVANSFLLGLYAPPAMVGFFSSAEKLSKAAAGLLNPIRESLYPRLSFLLQRNRREGIRLARVGAILMGFGGVSLSAILFFGASFIVNHLLGRGFEPTVRVLRILSLLPLLLAATFSAGQLWLLPLKQDRSMNQAIFGAAIINITLSVTLAPRWQHIGMAYAVLISEGFVAITLTLAVVRNIRLTSSERSEAQSTALPAAVSGH